MRQFFWGMVFGAICVWGWVNYGDDLKFFKRYTENWREGAVRDTKGYRGGQGAGGERR